MKKIEKIANWLEKEYGDGGAVKLEDGRTGIMYGNDECYEVYEFYQYIIIGDMLYRAYYDVDDVEDLDRIDYTKPYRIDEEDIDYLCDYVI